MARRLYNRGDAAWTTDVGAATALQRLRDLRMVDRNTGISLTDTQVTTPGTVGGLDWNPVTVTINSLIEIGEPLYLVNKHIILTDAGRLRANTGGYIQFFNCTIEVTSGGGAAHTAAQQPFNDGINANTGGHVTGQGSHFYGSTMFQNHPVAANLYLSMLDGMNSDFAFAPAANFVSVSLMPAARMINASIYGQAVNSGAITYYNAPAILEGVRVGGVAFEGNTGANSTNLILEPDFTDLSQVRKFFLQNNTSTHSLFQQAGFFSWPSNTLADIIFTGGNTGQAYLAQNNSDRGGVIGYYGWKPEISLGIPTRDADGVLTNGVQGVNVRVGSGAILTATTAGTSAANNVGTRLSFGTAQDQTGNDINLETEYVTNTNGVVVIDSNTMVTSDGWDTEAVGWVDWLKLGVENDTAQADNPGGNILGQNFVNQNLPDNTAIVPLQVAQNRNVRQYPGRIQLRGYGVEVDFESTELGTVGTGAGQQTANSLVEIEDVEVITTSLSGVRVKASNVNADNTPNLSFNGSTPASLQDIANAVRSGWSQYEFDANYDAGDATFPDAAPFNANAYPMNIVLSATAPTETGNITFAENGYGIGLLSNNIIEVAVHTSGLSALANDILNNDPTRVQTIEFGGRGVDGIIYSGSTTGNFGAITNGTNITSTDATSRTVASMDSSTIDFTGGLNFAGTVNNSTITSDGVVASLANVAVTGSNVNCSVATLAGATTNSTFVATSGILSTEETSGNTFTSGGAVTLGGTSTDDTVSGITITLSGQSNNTAITATGNITASQDVTDGTWTTSGNITVQNETITNLTATTTGTGDLFLNGSTISGGTFVSADNCNLSQGASTNGTSVTAADNMNVDGTGTHTDSTLISDNINNASSGQFVSGMTFGPSGSSQNINFNNLSGTTTLDAILGTGWNFTSNGSVVITNTSGSNATITVDEDDLTALGITLAQGASTNPLNGIIYSRPAAEVVSYDVTIGGTLDEIRARGGRFAIWNETSTSAVLAPVTIGPSTTMSQLTASKLSTDESIWRVYYKPNTGWGAGRTAYGMTLNADGTILSVGQIAAPVSVGVNVHVSAITSGSLLEPSSGYGVYTNATAAGVASPTNLRMALNVDEDPDGYSGGETQATCLDAANSEAYFLMHYNRVRTTEAFAPGANNASDWTGAGYAFVSGDGATPPLQQIISQISGLLTQSPNGYPEVLGVTEGSATVATVQQAVAGAVTTGVESGLTTLGAATRQDLANGFNTGQVFENGAPVGVNTNA